jgi:N-acetylglucosaminyl-diphospho-decaprenol L-rhamnosyltransferase
MALLDYASQHPGRLPLGGRSFHADGRIDPRTCWGLPSLWSTFCFALGLSTWRKRSRLFDPESMGNWERDDDRVVGVVTGYLLLIPLAVWQQLGGLDARFFMYGEDTDLSLRAKRNGYRPAIVPSATLVHEAGASSTARGKLVLVLQGKSTYMRKHWGTLRGSAGVALLQLGVGMRALVESSMAHEALWAYAWAKRREWRAGYRESPPSQAVVQELRAS